MHRNRPFAGNCRRDREGAQAGDSGPWAIFGGAVL